MHKILLVEDNEVNQAIMTRRLRKRGFLVVLAVDGKEGIDMAHNEKPDLILMDMQMPVLDGWEATRRLKQSQETCKIPVIGLSAHALSSDSEKALKAGCDDYETKPVDLPRLLLKIKKFLRLDTHS